MSTSAVRHRALALATAALALSTAAPVLGAPPPTRLTGLVLNAGKLDISVGLWDLFRPEDRQRLSSGFVTRVLIRMYVQPLGGGEAIVRTFQAGEIVYDLWGERYQVRVTSPRGPQTFVEADADAAIRRATSLWQFPITDVGALDASATYVIGFRGDLNPISEELVSEVKRWLLRSPSHNTGAADSFMGSFVSIFVNPRIEDSERQLLFFSQRFRLVDLVRLPPRRTP